MVAQLAMLGFNPSLSGLKPMFFLFCYTACFSQQLLSSFRVLGTNISPFKFCKLIAKEHPVPPAQGATQTLLAGWERDGPESTGRRECLQSDWLVGREAFRDAGGGALGNHTPNSFVCLLFFSLQDEGSSHLTSEVVGNSTRLYRDKAAGAHLGSTYTERNNTETSMVPAHGS